MKDKSGNIIYIGKAKNLKNRVSSYFRENPNHNYKTAKMVSQVYDYDFIVTDSEYEALILECSLIKQNNPKYNILLKDDKGYHYIKISKEDYPRITDEKNISDDGEYLGPYMSGFVTRETVNEVNKVFMLPTCNKKFPRDFRKGRPCLNYHIKKCLAPCMGYVSKEDYRKQIDEIIDILDGKVDKVLKELEKQMIEESRKMNFEQAAYIRDRMLAIQRVNEKQKVSNITENNIDVIGIAKSEIEVCVEIFFVRGSKMVGREHYFFQDIREMEDKEIISGFIKQYYIDSQNLPNKIMVREELEDQQAIEQWLSKEAGRKVEIKAPKKGEKLRFVEMADNNAKITLENKERDRSEILVELKEVLGLDKLPRKIETFDISNISGEYMVAGMCVMVDGTIKRNMSRRFKIKTVLTQDDPKCMQEVVTRRLKHSIDNSNSSGFGKLPDAIFADGGITQIRAIKQAVKSLELDIPVFGMVKNDKHQTRALINEQRQEFEISENLMNLITKFQDEVHDTAISYHRKLRDDSITKSELDDIKGIGEAKKKALLKYFGSVEKIKNSSIEEIVKVNGINKELAKNILEQLHQ